MRKSSGGFTFIEVLIVLAIASFILMIVFLAVPALQRNSRNYQRKQDASRIVNAINEYKGISASGLPGTCSNTITGCFLHDVRLSIYDNQSTAQNNVSFWNRTAVGPFQDGSDTQLDPATDLAIISVRSYTKCNGNQMTGNGAVVNSIAAQYVTEGVLNSSNTLVCVEF